MILCVFEIWLLLLWIMPGRNRAGSIDKRIIDRKRIDETLFLIFRGNCDFLNIGSRIGKQFLTVRREVKPLLYFQMSSNWKSTVVLRFSIQFCKKNNRAIFKKLRRKRELSTSVFGSIIASICSMIEKKSFGSFLSVVRSEVGFQSSHSRLHCAHKRQRCAQRISVKDFFALSKLHPVHWVYFGSLFDVSEWGNLCSSLSNNCCTYESPSIQHFSPFLHNGRNIKSTLVPFQSQFCVDER